jgi:hypothetical protein
MKNRKLQFCRSLCSAFAVLFGLVGTVPASATTLTAGPVVNGTDFAMFGVSGLRGLGAGNIVVSGVTGTVTRAILVWHGVVNGTGSAAGTGTFGSTAVTGTSLGLSADNDWGATSSQGFFADVTAAVSGNGTYSLSNFRTTTGTTLDPNGASLLVFYNDGNPANNRNITVFWGNDSDFTNTFDTAGWAASLTPIAFTAGDIATMRLIVSDGQTVNPDNIVSATINGGPITLPEFSGNQPPAAGASTSTGGFMWDHAQLNVTSFLVPGTNTLTLNANYGAVPSDGLSLIAVIIDSGAPAPAPSVPTLSSVGAALMAALVVSLGWVGFRRRHIQ